MTHDIIRYLLDDYVTGELDPEASAAVSDHLAGCAVCSGEAEGLRQVVARSAQLPRSIDPPPEAWTNIRSAILQESRKRRPDRSVAQEFFRRRSALTLAAAAAVIAVLSSAGTALYVTSRVQGGENADSATHSSGTAVPATLAAFTVEENNYLRTANGLQDILDQQESALAPETVAQLKASLRTIDEAILEARSALARDPANKLLIEMLSANYRQKVDLLRRSTEMTRGS
jgi:predicted anti-sigma-YlaC factor YlaD